MLSETNNDPVKKAGVISNIVLSISKIPDRITRSVYAKECSKLLQIDEEIIMQDIRLKLHTGNKLSNLGMPKPVKKSPAQNISDDIELNKLSYAVLESEILTYLLKFGEEKIAIEEGEAVIEYRIVDFIKNEFAKDELELNITENRELYNNILEIYETETEIKESLFIHHQDIKISKHSIKILETPYELSKIHKIKDAEEYEKAELRENVPHTINVLKMKIVIDALNDIEKELNVAFGKGENDKVLELLQKNKILSSIKKSLSELLGRVIF